MITNKTTPFEGQKPGTSGLRKSVKTFQEDGYLENFVQSIFDVVKDLKDGTLIVGGDGRYHNDTAIQIILRMASANGVKHVIVGKDGLLSTPAVSALIRQHKAQGGLVLSASHNPGGPDGDFGIKFNSDNGGPAPVSVTDAIYARSLEIAEYRIDPSEDLNLGQKGQFNLSEMEVSIIDSVEDYADLMETLFDFNKIRKIIASDFTMCFDAMHAVTGPYAVEIFHNRLGIDKDALINIVPLPDFGGGHPDPNPVYARTLFDTMFSDSAPKFGAASDGDGDRNIILGKGIFVSPSDSLAVITANAHLTPGYKEGIKGVARSMPTSRAADRVAKKLGIEYFETPTGWKYFGNLLDAGRITICGEESAGTSSDHIREKDGLWAVLMWMNILAEKRQSVREIMRAHWQEYGRNYYARHDYESVDKAKAESVMDDLAKRIPNLVGAKFGDEVISMADSFSYTDPVDDTIAEHQGLRVEFESGSRFVMRLSGTGTVGATLRLYLEKYVPSTGALEEDLHVSLAPIEAIAIELTDLKSILGREKPSVIS